jgi:hypothetical protein
MRVSAIMRPKNDESELKIHGDILKTRIIFSESLKYNDVGYGYLIMCVLAILLVKNFVIKN